MFNVSQWSHVKAFPFRGLNVEQQNLWPQCSICSILCLNRLHNNPLLSCSYVEQQLRTHSSFAVYCSGTSNKRGANTGRARTIEMAATEVNLSQLPVTFPLNKTDHNLSLSPSLCRVSRYRRAAWVGDKWSECVYVCVWFMYCCVCVRRPRYQDHHLPIDIEMQQQWRDPSVDPETPDTHLEQHRVHHTGIGWVCWSRRRRRRKRRWATFCRFCGSFFFSFKGGSSSFSRTPRSPLRPLLSRVDRREAATVVSP